MAFFACAEDVEEGVEVGGAVGVRVAVGDVERVGGGVAVMVEVADPVRVAVRVAVAVAVGVREGFCVGVGVAVTKPGGLLDFTVSQSYSRQEIIVIEDTQNT